MKRKNHLNGTEETGVFHAHAPNHLYVEDHDRDHCEGDQGQGPDQLIVVEGQDRDRLAEDRALDRILHQEGDVVIPDHLHADPIVHVRVLVRLAEDREVVGEEVTLVPGHEHHRVEGKFS